MTFTAFETMDDDNNLSADTTDAGDDMLATAGTDAAEATDPIPSLVTPSRIKTVKVNFTKAIRDARGRVMPFGTAVATYGDGTTLSVEITGGARVPTYGITDAVQNHAVTRIEGSGYRNHKGQPMPYAVFYNRGEALHVGRLDLISHGCVHVGDVDKMKRLNRGSAVGRTKVSVNYGPGVLDKIWNQHM